MAVTLFCFCLCEYLLLVVCHSYPFRFALIHGLGSRETFHLQANGLRVSPCGVPIFRNCSWIGTDSTNTLHKRQLWVKTPDNTGPTFKQYTPEIQHRTTNLFIKAPSIFSGTRYLQVCPTAEDLGVLMSSVFVVFKCVGGRGEKEGTGDWARGLKMGSWLWAWGQQGQRCAATYREPPFQVRGLFLILNIHKYYTCYNI
jgi:hypothetical protein